MISALLSRIVILVFGTLYPAYSSYKAVKTKDIKLYVKWMMYWIVFALFITAETFTDIFLGFWFPFYYEMKIILVIWLLSPVTRGSSIMYRKVIHPLLLQREREIDELLVKAKEQGYHVILDMGCKGMSLATNVILNTAAKSGKGLLHHLKKSYSLDDFMNPNVVDKINEEQQIPVSRKHHFGSRHGWLKCNHECKIVTSVEDRNVYCEKTFARFCDEFPCSMNDSLMKCGSTSRNQDQFVTTFFQDVNVSEIPFTRRSVCPRIIARSKSTANCCQ